MATIVGVEEEEGGEAEVDEVEVDEAEVGDLAEVLGTAMDTIGLGCLPGAVAVVDEVGTVVDSRNEVVFKKKKYVLFFCIFISSHYLLLIVPNYY